MIDTKQIYAPIKRAYMKERHEVVQPEGRSYKIIPLTKGYSTKVSANRYDFLMQWAWSISNGYAVRGSRIGKKVKSIRMHRVVLGMNDGDPLHVDHINGDTLDNRDENLRIVTVSQNMINRKLNRNTVSGVKGISIKGNKYHAYVSIGTFDTLEEAKEMREKYARMIQGEFYREV